MVKADDELVERRTKMTKFNPEGKEKLTYGECLSPAMKITNEEDAAQYLKEYINFIQKMLDKEPHKYKMTAEQIAKENLGYYAGYYDHKTRLRVERLFLCSHPVFGKAMDEEPTIEKALNAGMKLAKGKK